MTAETGQRKGPDFKLTWRRLELVNGEGLPLTEDQRRAFQIRGLTEALSITVGSLLCDPGVEEDPDLREHLIETCNQHSADLGRLGVSDRMFEGRNPDTLQEHLELAQYAASLLIGEEFEKLPSRISMPGNIVTVTGSNLFVFLPEETPGLKEWTRIQRKLITVWDLLGTNTSK